MELYSKPQLGKTRKWSRLTADYARWLFPLINSEGYGLKWNGRVVHCNTELELALWHKDKHAYIREFKKNYLCKFSKTHLEKVTTDQTAFYFTGGVGRFALMMLDIDRHNGEPDVPEHAAHLLTLFPGAYHEPSERGHHLYLIIDKQGLSPFAVNEFYKFLGGFLQQERLRLGFISDIEVKGYIQHDDPKGWYCGLLARIPTVTTSEQLSAIKQTATFPIIKLLTFIKEREGIKERNSIQTILTGKFEGVKCDKPSNHNKIKKPNDAQKNGSCPTVRRLAAFWQFVRDEGSVPELGQLLKYIQANGFFTKPWSYHEHQRQADCHQIIEKNRHKHNPVKAIKNYNELAKKLADKAPKLIKWEDISIYLSVVELAIIKDPNDDGSVPHERIEELWSIIARRKHLSRHFDNKRSAAIRRYLVTIRYLQMVDEHFGKGKAMRFTLGVEHPEYATTDRIIIPPRTPDAGIDPGFDPSKFLPRHVA